MRRCGLHMPNSGNLRLMGHNDNGTTTRVLAVQARCLNLATLGVRKPLQRSSQQILLWHPAHLVQLTRSYLAPWNVKTRTWMSEHVFRISEHAHLRMIEHMYSMSKHEYGSVLTRWAGYHKVFYVIISEYASIFLQGFRMCSILIYRASECVLYW